LKGRRQAGRKGGGAPFSFKTCKGKKSEDVKISSPMGRKKGEKKTGGG